MTTAATGRIETVSANKNTKGFCYIVLCLCLVLSQSGLSAYFENLSIEDGLSQGSVYDIRQDKQGYLWVATNDGLNRYDGINFRVFNNADKNTGKPFHLSNNNIYYLTPDDKGNFWVSTHYGLNYFNTKTYEIKHFIHNPNNEKSLVNNTIRNTLLDEHGNLWLATYGGLNRLDTKNEVFYHYKVPDGVQCATIIRALMFDRDGQLWVGANESGLCKFNPQTEEFTPIDYRNNPVESASIGIRDIVQDSDGSVWIASVKGLFHYNPKSKTSTPYFYNEDDENSIPNNWVQKIRLFNDEQFWIATAGGLALFDKTLKQVVKIFKKNMADGKGLSNEEVYSLYLDQGGLLWIGTNGGGLNKYNPRQSAFKYIGTDGKPGKVLIDPAVWEVSKAYGYLWISTTKGLNRYDLSSGDIKYYLPDTKNENSLVHENIFSISIGKDRDLWLGTQGGLSHFYIDREIFINYRHDIKDPNSIPFKNIIATAVDMNGIVWLCSFGEGFASFNPKTKKFRLYKHDPKRINSISNDFVYDVEVAKDGHIWFGTLTGLDRFSPKTNSFTHYQRSGTKTNGADNEIIVMNTSKNGNILIGTPNGLHIFNPATENFKSYSLEDGLEDDYIYGIEEDKQKNLWVSTNRGLSKINPTTHKIYNFGVNDGLQGYEFNGTASFNDGHHLYFGGFNGLNYFLPNEIIINDYIPPVVITNFRTQARSTQYSPPPDSVNLSHKNAFFSIEFAALDYTNSKRNQYAYKLEGFDTDWNYSGNYHYASYTNLDGGTYTFKVKAANKYGIWNETGASMTINIEAPPWKRWWAYTLYILVVVSIIVFIIRYKTLSDSRSLAERLRRMSTSLTQTLNLETIQNQLANHLQLLLPYRQILIYTMEGGRFREGLNYSFDHRLTQQLNSIEKNRIFDYFTHNHQPLDLNKQNKVKEFLDNSPRWEDKHILVIPLMARKDMVGFVMLVNPKSHEPYQSEQISIAVTLCAQASTAIDNAQLFQETKQLAFYDHLTGLANRRLFKERLEQVLKTIKRNHQGLAVMLLDLDHFKRVNDSLGHDVGDMFLKEAANRLLNCVRIQDTVARIGGDEFTILLTDVDGFKAATIVAQKILAAFAVPIKAMDYTINLSTSIGISLAPKDSIDANVLMKNADVALYKAKDTGRNNYQFYTEEMNIQASKHLSMESELHRAYENREFEIHYQPLINLSDNSICSIEALIRWNHPENGLLLPSHFISYAEETGFIKSLGEWVIQNVITFSAKLMHEHQTPTKIIVNLSTKQIIHGYLIDTITYYLNKFKLDAKWIGLEITENSLIQNTLEAIKVLSELKKIGITIAIDDFGTGYSSLSYLKKLPIDIIKIDRSFIDGIPDEKEDIEIAAAIIAMSHKLGLQTVAEGVETQAQLDFLKQNQCDLAQGFYLYRPLSSQDLINILISKQKFAKER